MQIDGKKNNSISIPLALAISIGISIFAGVGGYYGNIIATNEKINESESKTTESIGGIREKQAAFEQAIINMEKKQDEQGKDIKEILKVIKTP